MDKNHDDKLTLEEFKEGSKVHSYNISIYVKPGPKNLRMGKIVIIVL